ncbi:hypothetical protein DERF_012988, partial [Dermatophagoides farinae]
IRYAITEWRKNTTNIKIRNRILERLWGSSRKSKRLFCTKWNTNERIQSRSDSTQWSVTSLTNHQLMVFEKQSSLPHSICDEAELTAALEEMEKNE